METEKPRAMTAAERIKKFRNKMKVQDPQFQVRENKRISKVHKAKIARMTSSQLSEHRHKVAARVAKCKANKKQLTINNFSSTHINAVNYSESSTARLLYRCPQTLGKAVKRLQSLPVTN